MKGDYEEFHALKAAKNKANQSQTKPISVSCKLNKSAAGRCQHKSDTFSWSWLPERLYCCLCEIGIL